MKEKKIFCPFPWMHSFINLMGEMQLCCTADGFNSDILDRNGQAINIKDQRSVDDIFNSPFMKAIRLQFIKNEWPASCERCRLTEMEGGLSRREVEYDACAELIDRLIAYTAPDGTVAVNVMQIDYRPGNLCNLQCRMCHPRSSHRWIEEWNKLMPDHVASEEELGRWKNNEMGKKDLLIRDLEKKLSPALTQLHFGGGEPLINPNMEKALKLCIDAGYASNIKLTYNTNITILPKEVLALWPSFKEVRILASIDAVGELNDYIRYGSSWERVDQNLRFLDQHASELKIQFISVCTTVQICNILCLGPIYEYLQSGFKHVERAPVLIDLYFPPFMQSKVLPNKLKELAVIRSREIKDRYEKILPAHQQHLLRYLDGVINFMNSEDLSHLIPRFKKFTREFDRSRKLDILRVVPELEGII